MAELRRELFWEPSWSRRPRPGLVRGLLLGLLATTWAPIVEETLFRGALYRFLRSWSGVWVSALICGAMFGAIHPYGSQGIVQVAASGVMYALLREWRGSLVAPVVVGGASAALIWLPE